MWFNCNDFGHEAAGRRGKHFIWDTPFMGGFWGGGPGRGGWGSGPRRGRVFEQGDLKLVILRLLNEKPRHGYEIIKELEERFAGTYSPSPGAVYPTLTMLEDLGYARATPEEGGKRIYEITPEGRAYLEQHRSAADDIFERIAQFGAGFFGGPMMDLHGAFGDVARAAYGVGARATGNAERLRAIKEILERAAREIEGLEKAGTQA